MATGELAEEPERPEFYLQCNQDGYDLWTVTLYVMNDKNEFVSRSVMRPGREVKTREEIRALCIEIVDDFFDNHIRWQR